MKSTLHPFARLALLACIGAGFSLVLPCQGQDLPLYPTTPRLTSAECDIDLDIAATMKRAHDALLAAGLTLHKPLPQTIGANDEWVFALINCARSEGRTRVIATAASNPTKPGESYRVCIFLINYMRTGQAPPVSTASFAGEWSSTYGTLSMMQEGNHVTGTYTHADGKLEGTVTGNVLRFQWTQNNGKGAGYFVLSDDGKKFEGYWSYTDNPDDKSGGGWTGTRVEKQG
jgi:hypothetical protein